MKVPTPQNPQKTEMGPFEIKEHQTSQTANIYVKQKVQLEHIGMQGGGVANGEGRGKEALAMNKVRTPKASTPT